MNAIVSRPLLRLYALCICMLLLAGSVVYAAYAADKQEQSSPLPVKLREPLTIMTKQGNYTFKVEVVAEPLEMQTGLMFREKMPKNTGMLFDFKEPRRIAMWMKNTILPLDMIFIAPNGKIMDIAENTTPFSTNIIAAKRPASAVLEVRAGTCNHYGIRIGDRVAHTLFNPEK